VEPKFPRPKVLVVDLPKDSVEVFRVAGYNLTQGSFGQPFRVPSAPGKYHHLKPKATLPNYTEQEVIVADLAAPEPVYAPQVDDGPPPTESSVWADVASGVIDPRPRVMSLIRKNFDRIYRHGGIFVFLADGRRDPGYVQARPSYGSNIEVECQLPSDNWGCLSVLDSIDVTHDHGVEMEPALTEAGRVFALTRHLGESHFSCVIKPQAWLENRWVTMATSKYGDPVAGVLTPSEEDKGWIIILPRVQNIGELVRELFDELLPELAPALFPQAEGIRWTRRDDYELPTVLNFKSRIKDIEVESRERIHKLEGAIEGERKESGFLHELLTESGDELVTAVIQALKALGFRDVRDVDALAEVSDEKKESLREDVQIWDRSPTLLVEVKGIGGLPREAASLQVTKYIVPRMREWDRTDVHGLSVINHQRNLPALDRNDHVFQEDVLANAEQQGFGLMTTWDLFRLVRGFQRNGWQHENVQDVVYKIGRVEPIPSHYEYVGMIDAYWERPGALALQIERGALRSGDAVAYELSVDFVEEHIDSLQVDDVQVEEAFVGSHAGVKTSLTKQQAKRGTRVYRVHPSPSGGDGST
jgi:hypothetical protein